MSARRARVRRAPETADAALAEVYARLPSLECRGLCAAYCGPVRMGPAEERRAATAGVDLAGAATHPDTLDCKALTALGRCSIYPARPMICRLWGVVESMPCPHGCRPEGGLIPDEQGGALLRAAAAIR